MPHCNNMLCCNCEGKDFLWTKLPHPAKNNKTPAAQQSWAEKRLKIFPINSQCRTFHQQFGAERLNLPIFKGYLPSWMEVRGNGASAPAIALPSNYR